MRAASAWQRHASVDLPLPAHPTITTRRTSPDSHDPGAPILGRVTQNHAVLVGERVRLRCAEPADAAARVANGRHAEILRMYGADNPHPAPYTLEQSLAWVDGLASDPLAWVIEHEGRCIGDARLHSLGEQDAKATYAVGLQSPELLGRGLGTEATRLVLAHAFGAMGLNRVSLRVLAFNEGAIRCYQKCGFVIEGRERQSCRIGDEWHDDIIMGALASDWRSNGGKHG